MELQEPYFAVIFTNLLTKNNDGYVEMADAMEKLARQQPGFLAFEHAREELAITVSYWESLDAIAKWKAQVDHQQAQSLGKEQWYSWYKVRICRVEREYEFHKP